MLFSGKLVSLVFLISFSFSCGRHEKFNRLALKVAGPIDVASSPSGKYFYVLNTDFDRSFNSGSILVISETGEKIGAVPTPRLGRSITVAGTDLIATFDKDEDDGQFSVRLYDLSADESAPKLARAWTSEDKDLKLECTPVSAAMRSGYDHFAVSCAGGRLFIGTLKSPRSRSELKMVREFTKGGPTYRALYLDSNRELLFAFPTDMSEQKTTDFLTADAESYDTVTGKKTDVSNEIPDDYENKKFRRKNSLGLRRRYQYLLYDIAAERALEFPERKLDDEKDPIVSDNARFIYFTLANIDGTPDTDAGVRDLSMKHYRTNFWTTQPDPFDPNAFYISHRGKLSKNAHYANNIIRVTIIGDLRQTDPVLPTSQSLNFVRVFGFKGELDEKNHFPGDFEVQLVNGQLSLVINHFKDLVNFRKNASFGVSAKVLDGGFWRGEVRSGSQESSYFQLAVNERGKILSCAFYGNAVIPLQLSPGTAINLGWGDTDRIE